MKLQSQKWELLSSEKKLDLLCSSNFLLEVVISTEGGGDSGGKIISPEPPLVNISSISSDKRLVLVLKR